MEKCDICGSKTINPTCLCSECCDDGIQLAWVPAQYRSDPYIMRIAAMNVEDDI